MLIIVVNVIKWYIFATSFGDLIKEIKNDFFKCI